MASIAEVKVDKQTGQIIPLHMYNCVDCGTVVNPKLALYRLKAAQYKLLVWLCMKTLDTLVMVV